MARNERLLWHRTARNWRQIDVADRLGVALITIQRWERGNQQPSAYYRLKLCALFETSAQELGLLEEAVPEPTTNETLETIPPVPSLVAEVEAIWTIPYARNPHFTGRGDLFDQLMQLFSSQETGQETGLRQAALTQAQAIKGLGGVGKTQIVAEYAYRSLEQERYTHTIWINAADEEAILNSFSALAEHLSTISSSGETDQRRMAAASLRWLEKCLDPWLLIFDNADDLSLIPAYLPTRGKGHILLTTRAAAVGALAPSVEVDCMNPLESTLLLLRRAQRETTASREERDHAALIALALAYLPLALDQAGAYIEETGCSFHDYFHLYQERRLFLLNRRGKQGTGYPESVATTWSLSFQRVEQTSPAAAMLLELCAFVAPDRIPEELLIEGASHWPVILQEAVQDRLSFNQMLETLRAFSLVKRLSEDRLLSIHRLVQVVQIERMSLLEQQQWAERMVFAVHRLFPPEPKDHLACWPQCQRYLEQAQACDVLIQQYHLWSVEAIDVLDRTGSYLLERGLYALAEPLFLRALHLQKQHAGAEDLQIAGVLHHLAHLYEQMGRYAEAETSCQRALEIREQQSGPEHPDVLASLNGLANILSDQARYEQAEQIYLRALQIGERQLSQEHPLLASVLLSLAILYTDQGRDSESESLYLRALQMREHLFGPDHPQVALTLGGLGDIFLRQGKYEQAEQLCQRAIRIWEQQMEPVHPYMIYALVTLAEVYDSQGKYAQAEPLYLRAWRRGKQQFGTEHPVLTYPLRKLANLYASQGSYDQAESFYLQALSIREHQAEAEHPDTAQVLHDFACFQQARHKQREAVPLYWRALAMREHVLGFDHPATLETRACLQEALLLLGQPMEIEQMDRSGA